MDPDERRALAALYERLAARIAEASPRCEFSGRCCDFPTSGHELWATELEIEYARDSADGHVPAAPSGLCPWHVDGLCTLRDGRPLGCRVYFCDPAWAGVMPRVYEEFHAELGKIHRGSGRPYRYRRFVDAITD